MVFVEASSSGGFVEAIVLSEAGLVAGLAEGFVVCFVVGFVVGDVRGFVVPGRAGGGAESSDSSGSGSGSASGAAVSSGGAVASLGAGAGVSVGAGAAMLEGSAVVTVVDAARVDDVVVGSSPESNRRDPTLLAGPRSPLSSRRALAYPAVLAASATTPAVAMPTTIRLIPTPSQ